MKKGGIKKLFQNNHHWFVGFVFITLLIILHHFVLLTGDDYGYSQPIHSSLNDFLSFHSRHYLRTNGRAIIHFFLTLAFADSDMVIWRIAAPIFTAAILLVTSKAFTNTKHDFRIMFSVLCVLYLCFGGAFSAAGIYSITPAFNYLYPLILMSFTALLTQLTYTKNKDIWWLPLVSFFAGATMEQIGIMSIGYIALIALANYISEKQLPCKSVIVSLITSVLGYLTVMLAPGTFVRKETSTRPFVENFIAGFTMLINIESFAIFNSIMILSLCYWLLTIKMPNKLLRIFNILLSVGLVLGHTANIFILFNNYGIAFDSNILVSLLWKLFDLMYIFAMVYVPALIFLIKKDSKYAMHMIIALGSIFILFFASVSEYRPLIPAVIVLSVFIALTAIEIFKAHHKLFCTSLAIIAVVCLFSFAVNTNSYYQNYMVEKENIQRVDEYKANKDHEDVLILLPCADAQTAAYSINHTEHDYYSMYVNSFKTYYGLPENTVIVIEERQ